jgi:MscS family membrane protein
VPADQERPADARAADLIVIAARWLIATLPLSLLVRQHISNATAILAVVAVTWLLILLNGVAERHLVRRIPAANYSATVSLLRVGRRLVDVMIVMVCVFAMLRRLGVNPTPLLAGLGVGGLAVALAAQKTLENLIAGASLIFDQAVRVGDFLRVDTIEVVEHIGLRSTRIRTMDRSLFSVPEQPDCQHEPRDAVGAATGF